MNDLFVARSVGLQNSPRESLIRFTRRRVVGSVKHVRLTSELLCECYRLTVSRPPAFGIEKFARRV